MKYRLRNVTQEELDILHEASCRNECELKLTIKDIRTGSGRLEAIIKPVGKPSKRLQAILDRAEVVKS